MNLARTLFGALLGRRLPITRGSLGLPGIEAPVEIARDRWGIPSIRAQSDADAWFGLGFCHGQDRSFQLELLQRVGRGTLAELVGPGAIPIDRLARRIGFYRSGVRQLAALTERNRAVIAAYAAGIGTGSGLGQRRRPNEFVILRAKPSPWDSADVLAVLKLQSFLLGSSWDVELARLRLLDAEGPEALAALEPRYPDWLPSSASPTAPAGPALDRIAADVEALRKVIGSSGASNVWALSGGRTATGRPILANDPHLAPSLPPHWYLCRIQTPEWTAAGATFVGGPAITSGHNGFCAWGLTAGLADNADLFIEEVGPDGCSVRDGNTFNACPVFEETIAVRGARPVTERVIETPRGSIVGPALEGEQRALSLRAVWLDPLPIEGLLNAHRARSFEEFRRSFAEWPGPSLSLAYADASGAIGWLLAGQAPVRRRGNGALPLPGWDPDAGWKAELIPLDQMPHGGGSEGFVASANARPAPASEGPFLGEDWLDGYRLARISEALRARSDWDVVSTQDLQLDTRSLPWEELRAMVLASPAVDAGARIALELLRDWDGKVSIDSPQAAVFELFLVDLTRRLMQELAPSDPELALARGFTPLQPQTGFAVRRVSQIVRLLRDRPPELPERDWDREIGFALSSAVALLHNRFGDDRRNWRWGRARPLTLHHPLGRRKPFDRIYNLGPLPCPGDANTVMQAAVDPLDPLGNPGAVPGLRVVVDVGNWERSRFSLPGGQSGNPLSPHYSDLLPYWISGRGVPIAFSEARSARASRRRLRLLPLE
jgi:penicillin G amidase